MLTVINDWADAACSMSEKYRDFAEGKAAASGKSFSRRENMKKIVGLIRKMKEKGEIWNYAIVHAQNRERAGMYAERLKRKLEQEPLYIMDISPVVEGHNGIGTVGIGLMYE